MAKLFLVRHGDTKLNSRQRFWGQTDVELSDAGLQQAAQLRDRLSTQKIDIIHSSPLSRCRVTAETIASKQKTEVTICDEIKEINFGYVEGLTFDEIKERDPEFAEVLSVWNARPRFPGGESFDELNERVHVFMKGLEQHNKDETILVVAHSGILRMLVCNLLQIGIKHWRQMRIDLGSLSILDTYEQGAILTLLNDTSHLKLQEP